MDEVREALLAIPQAARLPAMVELWIEATAKERPDWRLPLLAAEAFGESLPNVFETGIVAAVGCMQTAIILVDDILDNEANGAQQRYGAGETANLAAAFQAVAFGLAHEVGCRMVDSLAAMALETAVGQQMDVGSGEVDEAGYWRLIRAKSGPFYGRSFELGAILQGAPRIKQQQMYELGCVVGEMVQIRDDLTDAMAEAPAAPDWTEGRPNLLLLYGRVAEFEGKERLWGLVEGIKSTPFHDKMLTQAQQILIDSGAVDYCLTVLSEKRDEGIALLDEMGLADDAKLRHLLNDMVNVLSLD